MTTISFGKTIKSLLNTKSIKALIDNKVYPLIAPLNTTFPYVVYQRTSTPQATKDNAYQDNVSIEIIIVSNNYDQSVNIAEIIRKEIECKRNIIVEGFNIVDIKLVLSNETYNNDAYLQSLTFNFRINL